VPASPRDPSPFADVLIPAPGTLPKTMRTAGSVTTLWSALSAAPVAGAPPPRRRSSAVVMLFIPGASTEAPAEIVLTRRSTAVRSHKGQIGFPGGRLEETDPTPAATALRELEEELGVPRDRVTPIAALEPLAALDGSAVFPIVAVSSMGLAAMRPSADEVDEVFAVAWPRLTEGEAQRFAFNIFGNWRESLLFPLPGRAGGGIWGLTAKILAAAGLG
jgi:8-oxo-dGTP pyrophosphatase MutT (NUDIX family)